MILEIILGTLAYKVICCYTAKLVTFRCNLLRLVLVDCWRNSAEVKKPFQMQLTMVAITGSAYMHLPNSVFLCYADSTIPAHLSLLQRHQSELDKLQAHPEEVEWHCLHQKREHSEVCRQQQHQVTSLSPWLGQRDDMIWKSWPVAELDHD